MKLTIEIEMDNAAFEPCNGDEAARILANYIRHDLEGECITETGTVRALIDINGNHVGVAKIIN